MGVAFSAPLLLILTCPKAAAAAATQQASEANSLKVPIPLIPTEPMLPPSFQVPNVTILLSLSLLLYDSGRRL